MENINHALLFAPMPEIIEQPHDIIANIGEDIVLEVIANTQISNLSFQWYENNRRSNENGNPIKDATTSVINLHTNETGINFYYCIITNIDDDAITVKNAEIAAIATIAVYVIVYSESLVAQEPFILEQPQSLLVTNDMIFKLSVNVIVVDGGTLSYQWYRNNIENNTNGIPINGATSATYISQIDTEETIYYYVVVTNNKNTTTLESTNITLPSISPNPSFSLPSLQPTPSPTIAQTTTASVTSEIASVTITKKTINAAGQHNGLMLTATITQLGVYFNWYPSTNPHGYRLYRSTKSGDEGDSVSKNPIIGDNYFDANLLPGVVYYYSIAEVIERASNMQTNENVLIDELIGPKSEELQIVISPSFIGKDDEESYGYIMMTIGDPYMTINGDMMEIDPGRNIAPMLQQGRTMLPIRAIVEAMDGSVDWDNDERRVIITKGDRSVTMWLDSKNIIVDGRAETIDIAPFTYNERTMLPVRFVIEYLGCQIEWIGSLNKVIIVYKLAQNTQEEIII